jgi:hypothetical protein
LPALLLQTEIRARPFSGDSRFADCAESLLDLRKPALQIQQIKPFHTQEVVYFLSAPVVYFYSALDRKGPTWSSSVAMIAPAFNGVEGGAGYSIMPTDPAPSVARTLQVRIRGPTKARITYAETRPTLFSGLRCLQFKPQA